jgi:hypothetical protein
MGRPYTGYDGDARGRRAGTEKFVQLICFLSGNKVWNNGTWVVRNARSKSSPSVHSTGRAVDFSWRKQLDRNRGGTYADAVQIMDFLVRNADLLKIELITDYQSGPFGRTWKCDRNAWKVYDKPTVAGAPGGDWFHVEIAPQYADDPGYYDNAVKQLFSNTAPAPAPTPTPAKVTPTKVSSVKVSNPANKQKPAEPAPKIVLAYPGTPVKSRSKGDAVNLVQAFLKVPVTGVADRATIQAVKAYQSMSGLKADGVVGPATWRAMFG